MGAWLTTQQGPTPLLPPPMPISIDPVYRPRITILAQQQVPDFLTYHHRRRHSREEKMAVVSIQSPGAVDAVLDDAMQRWCDEAHIFRFEDLCHGAPSSGPQARHVRSLRQVADRLKELRIKNVVVHCRVGVSRSSGATLVLLERWGVPAQQAIDYLFTIRPQADPNCILVAHLSSEYRKALFQRLPIVASRHHGHCPIRQRLQTHLYQEDSTFVTDDPYVF